MSSRIEQPIYHMARRGSPTAAVDSLCGLPPQRHHLERHTERNYSRIEARRRPGCWYDGMGLASVHRFSSEWALRVSTPGLRQSVLYAMSRCQWMQTASSVVDLGSSSGARLIGMDGRQFLWCGEWSGQGPDPSAGNIRLNQMRRL
jgi:hypothetical protein